MGVVVDSSLGAVVLGFTVLPDVCVEAAFNESLSRLLHARIVHPLYVDVFVTTEL